MVVIFDPVLGALRISDKITVGYGVVVYYIGGWDASTGNYPSTGGTGESGAVKKGNLWRISVAGILPIVQSVGIDDTIMAIVDNPGNTESNWLISYNNSDDNAIAYSIALGGL